MAIDWDEDRIKALNDEDLESLTENLIRLGKTRELELCQQEFLVRGLKSAPQRAKERRLKRELVKNLTQLADYILATYDLSKQTARQISDPTFRFYPHKLLSKRNFPKIGGAEKTRRVVFDRYISYRLKDEVYAILVLLIKGEEYTRKVRYQVFGPNRLLDGFIPLNEIRPYLEENETIGLSAGGLEYETFEEAAEKFIWLIDQVAPKLKAQFHDRE